MMNGSGGGGGMARAPAAVVALALAAILSTPAPEAETFANIPPTLSGGDGKQQVRIKRPKSAKALQCTSKCVATCIRGGEGPFNVRKPLVVFKQQFRSRQYCARMSAISSRMEKMGNEECFDQEKQKHFEAKQGWMQGEFVTDFYTRN